LSRNDNTPSKVNNIILDRRLGLLKLKNVKFDVIIDFICYSDMDVQDVSRNLIFNLYILISTTWLSKIESTNFEMALPLLTKKYLLGKRGAEAAVNRMRSIGKPMTIIRLPVLSGYGDHTKRLGFYFSRILDKGGVFRINGGENILQIANVEDVSLAISSSITSSLLVEKNLWDAIPDSGNTLKAMLNILSKGVEVAWCDVSSEFLRRHLPSYLEVEPFWREYKLPESGNNIFNLTKVEPKSLDIWISDFRDSLKLEEIDLLRRNEINLIKSLL
jgi:hypothetical protein